MLYHDHLDTPIGRLQLLADADGALLRIEFPHPRRPRPMPDEATHDPGRLAAACEQLSAYFAGERLDFDLPLRPQGTVFQLAVWEALRGIDYGGTESYAGLARRIDRPRAVRAVGAANGANPLPIIVPCHRVIGADGSLTGFGGGLETKRWLLAHERRHAPVPPLQLEG